MQALPPVPVSPRGSLNPGYVITMLSPSGVRSSSSKNSRCESGMTLSASRSRVGSFNRVSDTPNSTTSGCDGRGAVSSASEIRTCRPRAPCPSLLSSNLGRHIYAGHSFPSLPVHYFFLTTRAHGSAARKVTPT
ncbi:hypothetical protein BKA93DRAFT_240450 [Sparassis latifolia]